MYVYGGFANILLSVELNFIPGRKNIFSASISCHQLYHCTWLRPHPLPYPWLLPWHCLCNYTEMSTIFHHITTNQLYHHHYLWYYLICRIWDPWNLEFSLQTCIVYLRIQTATVTLYKITRIITTRLFVQSDRDCRQFCEDTADCRFYYWWPF